jgi:hypothetical protein
MCFGADTIEGIFKRVSKYENEDWAQKTLRSLKKASPTSLKVCLKLFKTFQNFSKLFKTFQNFSKLFKTFQNFSKLFFFFNLNKTFS